VFLSRIFQERLLSYACIEDCGVSENVLTVASSFRVSNDSFVLVSFNESVTTCKWHGDKVFADEDNFSAISWNCLPDSLKNIKFFENFDRDNYLEGVSLKSLIYDVFNEVCSMQFVEITKILAYNHMHRRNQVVTRVHNCPKILKLS
jgi:hypothetical protein